MTENTYDAGRLNLPFVGICTFGKYPYVENWDKIKADVAVLGAPFDFGSQFRSGARMGPRGIREASTLFLLVIREPMIMKMMLCIFLQAPPVLWILVMLT